MQAIASRNPLNWVVQIGRSAVSASPDWGAIAVRCGGLLVLAVACVAVSVVTFRSVPEKRLKPSGRNGGCHGGPAVSASLAPPAQRQADSRPVTVRRLPSPR